MRIKKIELKNFKRFSDLVISDVPHTSKLVLIIGSNGSGKSSLFDAFDWLNKGPYKGPYKGLPYNLEESTNYYRKHQGSEPSILIELTDSKLIKKIGLAVTDGNELVKKFLGRSSIRIVPRITNTANLAGVSNDQDSPTTYIEHDTRFINDVFLYIQGINNALREPVFSGKQADTLKIFDDFIRPLNDSLLKIFGGNETTIIKIAEFQDASPGNTAKLIFKKGESKINYDLLSHGEKQVVTLLINFIVRYEYYDNSIIFIDEMDTHLNTSLQYNLMNEIVTRWIPDNAQLWTASHSLGFIDYAKKSDLASTIDFDLLNFDIKQELIPISKEKLDIYEIAIPKSTLSSILGPGKGKGRARGLMQVTDFTMHILGNHHGELSDYLICFDHPKLLDPTANICAGVRWLFRSMIIAKSKMGQNATWIDGAAQYKGKLGINPPPREMEIFLHHYSCFI